MPTAIRHLGGITLPRQPRGTLPGAANPIARGQGGGPIPRGYGRLVVMLKCARNQKCGPHASIWITPMAAYGYTNTIVPASADTSDGSPCWADVPAGSWQVSWHTAHGLAAMALEITPGIVQGFGVDLPTGAQPIRYVGSPLQGAGYPTLNEPGYY